MKKFIITTTGGYTQDEEGRDTDNLQVLDFDVEAGSAEEAIKKAVAAGKTSGFAHTSLDARELAK
jgi:hypothetical protein